VGIDDVAVTATHRNRPHGLRHHLSLDPGIAVMYRETTAFYDVYGVAGNARIISTIP